MASVRIVLTASFSSGDFSLDTVSPVVSGMGGPSTVRDPKVAEQRAIVQPPGRGADGALPSIDVRKWKATAKRLAPALSKTLQRPAIWSAALFRRFLFFLFLG